MSNIIGWNIFCNISRSFAIAKDVKIGVKDSLKDIFVKICYFLEKN
jgi:hypothetical protein